MKKVYKFVFMFFIFLKDSFAHERWLLTPQQLTAANKKPLSPIFRTIGFFNSITFLLACTITILWIYFFSRIKSEALLANFFRPLTNYASFFLRLGVGTSLLISAFGIIPRAGIDRWVVSTLFTPDLPLLATEIYAPMLKGLEIVLGVFLLVGFYTRIASVILTLLAVGCLYWFGEPMIQYFLLYFASFIYLITQGPGALALKKESHFCRQSVSLLFLQLCTGLSFMYTAINYKLLQPNLDIAILTMHKSFTFGLSYNEFTFMMTLTEFFSGLLIIIGYGLRFLSIILLFLFIFLAINMHENLFGHNFIYGILITFLINGGTSINKPKISI